MAQELEQCALSAIESRADSFNKIETHIRKKQKCPTSGLESVLLSMVRSGEIAVTNGRYWIRTGVAPRFGEGKL
jgi:fructose-1-phosphate kinase PfkB-like protein